MKIIGISSFYHDSAVALLENDRISAAVQEERFSRVKHDRSFPKNSLEYCLKVANCNLHNIDYVVFYEKPIRKFSRILSTFLDNAPQGLSTFLPAMSKWLNNKLYMRANLVNLLKEVDFRFSSKQLLFAEHHQSHAGSAFYPSPFEEAAILTMDGVGEWATTSICAGYQNQISPIKEIHFPHSIGLLYSAFTQYLGFKVNSGEYKIMGLAPYGLPKYSKLIKDNLISINRDGSFQLNLKYFDYCVGTSMTNELFNDLFKGSARSPDANLTQDHMDLAASIQKVIEEAVLILAQAAQYETGFKNLCLAGGVALNCTANGKLIQNAQFNKVWIQPASGDAGGALGAALSCYYGHLDNKRTVDNSDKMSGSYLGPEFDNTFIGNELEKINAVFHRYDTDELLKETAKLICEDKVIGWFQGRSEFGPRALGNRSILGDPRSEFMQRKMNLSIKFRESFRPFAPSVTNDSTSEFFDISSESPYMLFTAPLNSKYRFEISEADRTKQGLELLSVKRSAFPAVTHVDFSARIQTVQIQTNELYYKLLKQVELISGFPILVNTSFNVRGEPIVNTPHDAFKCFMGTHMDILVIGNFILKKELQTEKLFLAFKDQFQLD